VDITLASTYIYNKSASLGKFPDWLKYSIVIFYSREVISLSYLTIVFN